MNKPIKLCQESRKKRRYPYDAFKDANYETKLHVLIRYLHRYHRHHQLRLQGDQKWAHFSTTYNCVKY